MQLENLLGRLVELGRRRNRVDHAAGCIAGNFPNVDIGTDANVLRIEHEATGGDSRLKQRVGIEKDGLAYLARLHRPKRFN